MRGRLIASLAVAAAVAGCGSSGTPGSGANPLSTELSYFANNVPLVMTVQTDPNGPAIQQAQGLLSHFPAASLGLSALQGKLTSFGLSYQNDIKPLLGNPVALGLGSLPSAGGSVASQNFLLVWVTKSSDALSKLLTKVTAGASSSGKRDGASLYRAGTFTVATDGATLLLGPSSNVTSALDRHAHGGGFTSAQYANDTAGLPQNALVDVFGSLSGALSASARAVPWVAAIRGYGAAITPSSAGIGVQFRVDTGAGSLTAQQVPIAPGTTPPSLAGTAPIVVGLKDPTQVVSFIEQASPNAFSTVNPRSRGTVRQLLGLLTGDLIIDSDTHTTLARAGLSDPARALALLPHAGPQVKRVAPGLYSTGKALVGVIGEQLVIGKHATAAQLRAFAGAPTAPASFAHGSVAFRIGLVPLLSLALRNSPSPILTSVLGLFGDVTGYASATPTALTGSATIAVK